MKKLDYYIIKKFLGTFFFTILLIIPVIIIFDLSEKLQDFIEKKAPVSGILFDYYINYVPYLVNQLSPLFIFISVIFFTSKMASNSEIIAILSSGISFNRLLRPYFIASIILTIFTFYLNNFLIPDSNKKRLAFEEIYYRNTFRNFDRDIHMQISKTTYIYMASFNAEMNVGMNFSIENFDDNGELNYKLLADNVIWDSISQKWTINNYYERHIKGLDEIVTSGLRKDTVINLKPDEFKRRNSFVQTMDLFKLNEFIEEAQFKGSEKISTYLVERQTRLAYPFATFILTIIGVSVSSRKVRGGIGMHIGVGLLISAAYILFMQIFTSFALTSGASIFIAVWTPNILFAALAIYLLRIAPK
ncbi:MAG: YjgP/YjgQ family permease [Flavobacteriales bacterium]|nr:YjgP/YjgQ family permease [Flavobacteriales bacterium]